MHWHRKRKRLPDIAFEYWIATGDSEHEAIDKVIGRVGRRRWSPGLRMLAFNWKNLQFNRVKRNINYGKKIASANKSVNNATRR